jgi:hypothetical protein
MIAAAPDRTAEVETPASEPEPEPFTFTTPAMLEAIRAAACRIDPTHRRLYMDMDAARIVAATRTAAELMQAHLNYRRHWRAGRGRRPHAARMHALLDASNVAELVIGLAWATVAGVVFADQPEPGA